jgi:uncharacterized membrane protein (GlpM family)
MPLPAIDIVPASSADGAIREAVGLMSPDEVTALRTLIAFLVAGSYVVVMTRMAEKFGSKAGGLLLALPSTIFVGVSFIAWQRGHDGLRQASAVLPTTIAAAAIFLVTFVVLSKRGLAVAYAGATVVWLAITFPLAFFRVHDVYVTTVFGVLLLTLAVAFFRHTPHRTARPIRTSVGLQALRFSVAGGVTGATVVVARFAGSTWAAVCGSFPAVFAATLFLMSMSQGIEFTTSLGRTMIVGNAANVVFAISIYVASVWLGSVPTIALAYLCSLLFAVVAYRYFIDLIGRAG